VAKTGMKTKAKIVLVQKMRLNSSFEVRKCPGLSSVKIKGRDKIIRDSVGIRKNDLGVRNSEDQVTVRSRNQKSYIAD
jgi:hypothetical protein